MQRPLQTLYGLRSYFDAFIVDAVANAGGNVVGGPIAPVVHKMAFYERLLTLPAEQRQPDYTLEVVLHGRHVQMLSEERLNAMGVGLAHGARLALNHFREALDAVAASI